MPTQTWETFVGEVAKVGRDDFLSLHLQSQEGRRLVLDPLTEQGTELALGCLEAAGDFAILAPLPRLNLALPAAFSWLMRIGLRDRTTRVLVVSPRLDARDDFLQLGVSDQLNAYPLVDRFAIGQPVNSKSGVAYRRFGPPKKWRGRRLEAQPPTQMVFCSQASQVERVRCGDVQAAIVQHSTADTFDRTSRVLAALKKIKPPLVVHLLDSPFSGAARALAEEHVPLWTWSYEDLEVLLKREGPGELPDQRTIIAIPRRELEGAGRPIARRLGDVNYFDLQALFDSGSARLRELRQLLDDEDWSMRYRLIDAHALLTEYAFLPTSVATADYAAKELKTFPLEMRKRRVLTTVSDFRRLLPMSKHVELERLSEVITSLDFAIRHHNPKASRVKYFLGSPDERTLVFVLNKVHRKALEMELAEAVAQERVCVREFSPDFTETGYDRVVFCGFPPKPYRPLLGAPVGREVVVLEDPLTSGRKKLLQWQLENLLSPRVVESARLDFGSRLLEAAWLEVTLPPARHERPEPAPPDEAAPEEVTAESDEHGESSRVEAAPAGRDQRNQPRAILWDVLSALHSEDQDPLQPEIDSAAREHAAPGPVVCRRITFTDGSWIYLRQDSKATAEVREELRDLPVSKLREGQRMLVVLHGERQDLFGAIIDRAHEHQALKDHVENAQLWPQRLRLWIARHPPEGMAISKLYGRFIQVVREEGAEPVAKSTLESWANDDVLGPRDLENLGRLARAMQDDLLMDRAEDITRSVRAIWSLHVTVGNRLNQLLTNVSMGAADASETVDLLGDPENGLDELGLTAADFIDAVDVKTIRRITTAKAPRSAVGVLKEKA